MNNKYHTASFSHRFLTLVGLPSTLTALACGSATQKEEIIPDVTSNSNGEYSLPACRNLMGNGDGSGDGGVDSGASGVDTGASGVGTGASGVDSGANGVENGGSSGTKCIDDEGNIVDVPSSGNDPEVEQPGFNCKERTFTYAGNADEVWISGTFTDPPWATSPEDGALVLTDKGDGTFALTTEIPAGTYEYKIVLNGSSATPEWIQDPANNDTVDDTVGGFNSALNVCQQVCGEITDFDWRDTVMYFAMVDRFFDADGLANEVIGATDGELASGQYKGGDLKGLTSKLPYLESLGVSAVWITAPYENRNSLGKGLNDDNMYTGYHGYWPSPENTDYSDINAPSPVPKVESRIGTAADLKAFVAATHGTTGKNGHTMKVLFDYVMNHVDDESALYAAHPDWFYKEDGSAVLCSANNNGNWDDPFYSTRCAFTKYLPAFDFEIAEARAWSVSDAIWWAKEYGIDGYRLDAIKHVPLSWLTELRTRINAEALDQTGDRFYLVGETFAYDDRNLLAKYVNPDTMLDGQFDFPFKKQLCEGVFASGGNIGALADWMDGNDGFYGPGSIMTTWIGNHDIPRAIHFASRDISSCTEGSNPGNGWVSASYPQPTDAPPYERLGVAFAVMFTNPGIPLIYYGDEVGLAGGGDPDNRRMMPWGTLNAHQEVLRERVKSLGKIRGENPVLSRGNRKTLAKTADIWVYELSGCDLDKVTIAINKSDTVQDVNVPAGTNLETEEAVSAGTLSLAARDFIVIK